MNPRRVGYEDFKGGPRKDRKHWRGVGLIAEHTTHDDGPVRLNHSASEGKPSNVYSARGASAEQSSAAENRIDKQNSPNPSESAEDAEQKSKTSEVTQPRVSKDLETSSASSAAPQSSANDEHTHVYTFSPDGSGMACRECGISYDDGLAQDRERRARDGSG